AEPADEVEKPKLKGPAKGRVVHVASAFQQPNGVFVLRSRDGQDYTQLAVAGQPNLEFYINAGARSRKTDWQKLEAVADKLADKGINVSFIDIPPEKEDNPFLAFFTAINLKAPKPQQHRFRWQGGFFTIDMSRGFEPEGMVQDITESYARVTSGAWKPGMPIFPSDSDVEPARRQPSQTEIPQRAQEQPSSVPERPSHFAFSLSMPKVQPDGRQINETVLTEQSVVDFGEHGGRKKIADVVGAADIVVLDFTALWCIHCQHDYPFFDDFEKKMSQVKVSGGQGNAGYQAKIVKVDADLNKAIIQDLQIGSLPTYVVLYRDPAGELKLFMSSGKEAFKSATQGDIPVGVIQRIREGNVARTLPPRSEVRAQSFFQRSATGWKALKLTLVASAALAGFGGSLAAMAQEKSAASVAAAKDLAKSTAVSENQKIGQLNELISAWTVLSQYLGAAKQDNKLFAQAVTAIGRANLTQESLEEPLSRDAFNSRMFALGIPLYVHGNYVLILDTPYHNVRRLNGLAPDWTHAKIRSSVPFMAGRNPLYHVKGYRDETRREGDYREGVMEGFEGEIKYRGALSYVKDGNLVNPFKAAAPQVTAMFRLPATEPAAKDRGAIHPNRVNYTGLAQLLGDLKQAFVAEAAEQEVVRNQETAIRNYPEVEKNLRRLGQTKWTDAQALKALAEIAPLAAEGAALMRGLAGQNNRDDLVKIYNDRYFAPYGFIVDLNPHDGGSYQPGRFHRILLAEIWDTRALPEAFKKHFKRSAIKTYIVDAGKDGVGGSGSTTQITSHDVQLNSFKATGGGYGYAFAAFDTVKTQMVNYIQNNTASEISGARYRDTEAPPAWPNDMKPELFKLEMMRIYPEEMAKLREYGPQYEDIAWRYFFWDILGTVRHENEHALLFHLGDLGLKNNEDAAVLGNAFVLANYNSVMRSLRRSAEHSNVYIFRDIQAYAQRHS
ncbi:MAG: thioredoxin family protein, partial [Candidatus Omnitrophica bacterium]|nr:thioredoxin family protein [Candidatus Omnitrophota bacterium]